MMLLRAFFIFVVMAFPVKAQETDIQRVISGQINAFLADDFDTAFTFAAPNIVRLFGTADRFGTMVQRGYPMVHRPASFRFAKLSDEAGEWLQKVELKDEAGRLFIAHYVMEQTETGWKIKGVSVSEAPKA
ncbi:DUF4864 domain-containing protein [Amylibacter sp. SFDW26]|uniref:DUF4864 domain-containing protein n=1 Tax=Amylibacter sp. SFDW26 TaxID=2652722 RepID=UPI001262A5B0|nr:DUF4864 domain-containing protein [Amylibacter sp. SFDW26]KAB7613430.1 DUF4864 domain-containing protein [Amylibacter sp. SFDW26]